MYNQPITKIKSGGLAIMKKLLSAVRFVSELFRKKQSAEFEVGKGPYASIDAEDGTAWSIYRRNGKKYTY